MTTVVGAEIAGGSCLASPTGSLTFGASSRVSVWLSKATTGGVSALSVSVVRSVGGHGSAADDCLESSHVGPSAVVGSSRLTSSTPVSNCGSGTAGGRID